MSIGDSVVLTEAVFVIDDLCHDLLLAGTSGIIASAENGLMSLQTTKGIYDNIPIASVKIIEEAKAA